MNQRNQRNERNQISQIDQPRISLVPPVSRQRDYRGCHRCSLAYSTSREQCEQPSGQQKKRMSPYISHILPLCFFQIPYRMPHTKPIGAVNMNRTGPFQLEVPDRDSCIPPPTPPSMAPTTANHSPYPAMSLRVITIYRITL